MLSLLQLYISGTLLFCSYCHHHHCHNMRQSSIAHTTVPPIRIQFHRPLDTILPPLPPHHLWLANDTGTRWPSKLLKPHALLIVAAHFMFGCVAFASPL
jgi:hypothetical protein